MDKCELIQDPCTDISQPHYTGIRLVDKSDPHTELYAVQCPLSVKCPYGLDYRNNLGEEPDKPDFQLCPIAGIVDLIKAEGRVEEAVLSK